MKFPNSIFVRGHIPVINKLIEKPLDISEAYKLVKFVKSLKEKEDTFNQAKLKIFEKYGAQDKEGNWFIKDKKKQAKAASEMDEILVIEEDYELDSKIKVDNDIKLSAAELMLLDDVIEIKEK